MILRYIALLATVQVMFVSSSEAQCLADSPGHLVLLLADSTAAIPCGPSSVTCPSLVTSGELDRTYKVYVILMGWTVFEEQGLREVQFGVNYDAVVGSGVDVSGFEACSNTVTYIGNWPEPGSQIRITYPFCIDPSLNPDADKLVLGSFGVIAHTPGTLTLGTPIGGPGEPRIVSRLIMCDQSVRLMDPLNQGVIGLGQNGWGGPCSGVIDAFEGPCCLPNQTCLPGVGVACCWDQGGIRLDYMATCGQCVTPLLPNTWGGLKSRYQ